MKKILLLLSNYFYYRPLDLRKILLSFKNLEEVMEAPKDAFLNLGVAGKMLDEFIKNRFSSVIPAQAGIQRQTQEDIKIITILDENYPAALKNIYDPPPILFYKGGLNCITKSSAIADNSVKPTLAVIGSRKASEYGRRAAELFVKDLAPHFTIVSGLAYGIDGLAHQAALGAGGSAVAVLGSGLDEASIYPKDHLFLARKIIEAGGLLLSEVPPGGGPLQFHFPMRNRIIAGLSKGILIVEGGQKSGTLITAKLGIEYGADIFCVPGNIFSENSAGVNFLIKCGAHPVTESRDILEFYGLEERKKPVYRPKNGTEKIILENLAGEGRQFDELARLTGIAIADLMAACTEMEMEGAIKNIGGKYVKI